MYRNEEDLKRLTKKARDVIESYGYHVEESIPIKLSGCLKDRRAWGACTYETDPNKRIKREDGTYVRPTKKIEIDKKFFESPTATEKDILQVLIHEYLHSVFSEDGHRGQWKKMANRITADGEYRITTTTAIWHYDEKMPSYEYTVSCPVCGAKFDCDRTSDFVRNPNKYTHISKKTAKLCKGLMIVKPFQLKKIEENVEENTENEADNYEQLSLF